MCSIREEESVKQFDRWSENYDRSIWYFYFNIAYKMVLSLSSDYIAHSSKILDIGCGTGELAFLLSRYATDGEIIGLDISEKMVETARTKCIDRDYHNIRFATSVANRIPYDDDFFDLIFCLNALHHFPDHPSFFREANRVLKQGGKFILLDLINDNPIRHMWILISKIIFKERNVEYHSKDEFYNIMHTAGFNLKASKPFLFFTMLFILEKLR